MRIHLDPNRRIEAIEAGWSAYKERVTGYEAQYRALCNEWDVIAVVADEVIGALFVKDSAIHLGIVPEWRNKWASKRIIREMLKYGTRTTVGFDEKGPKEFISRIGFVETGKVGEYVFRR